MGLEHTRPGTWSRWVDRGLGVDKQGGVGVGWLPTTAKQQHIHSLRLHIPLTPQIQVTDPTTSTTWFFDARRWLEGAAPQCCLKASVVDPRSLRPPVVQYQVRCSACVRLQGLRGRSGLVCV